MKIKVKNKPLKDVIIILLNVFIYPLCADSFSFSPGAP